MLAEKHLEAARAALRAREQAKRVGESAVQGHRDMLAYPPDSITDSAVVDIAISQEPDGHWGAGEKQLRPPIAQSHFAGTTRAIRMLQAYSIPARKAEFAERIGRARAWLLKSKPVTTEDHAMKLSGLTFSGASKAEIEKAAQAVLALQRPDGGWSGNPYMTSDAYATSGALRRWLNRRR